jgi:hypothetical protein
MRKASRKNFGHITEFAAGIVLLITFILIPILDFGFVPVRYWMSTGTLNCLVQNLARSDKRSDAYELLNNAEWIQILSKYGMSVSDTKMTLIARDSTGNKEAQFSEKQQLPAEWLPNGANAPCIYSLELQTTVSVNPCFGLDLPIPILNQPIPFHMNSRSQWENLGSDPTTMGYYINE